MSFLSTVGKYFLNIFRGIAGQLGASISQFLHDFVATDLGKLAGDAVAWAEAEVSPSTPDKTAIRDAAKAKFIADAKTAGHDVTVFSESLLNFFIESAYQAFLAGAVKLPLPVAPVAPVTPPTPPAA